MTNNSAPTLAELVDRLRRAGVQAAADDLVTSAQAAATPAPAHSRVLVLADGGAVEALAGKDVTIVEEGPADVVLVGWTHRFDFDRLAAAATAVRAGRATVGTNEDPTNQRTPSSPKRCSQSTSPWPHLAGRSLGVVLTPPWLRAPRNHAR